MNRSSLVLAPVVLASALLAACSSTTETEPSSSTELALGDGANKTDTTRPHPPVSDTGIEGYCYCSADASRPVVWGVGGFGKDEQPYNYIGECKWPVAFNDRGAIIQPPDVSKGAGLTCLEGKCGGSVADGAACLKLGEKRSKEASAR